MRDYHRELVADRGMDMEAHVLEIIRGLQAESFEPGPGISIQQITTRFAEQHGDDYERKITPHWIGRRVRRKPGLKTERYREGYVIVASERPKLDQPIRKIRDSKPARELCELCEGAGNAAKNRHALYYLA
jgi:hypothetical protein